MDNMLREAIQAQKTEAELEAQKHNAMISERYNRLKNAVANQFAEDTRTEERRGDTPYQSVPEKTTYISPNAATQTATYTQTPMVTEYISRSTSPLFTTEKFERIQQMNEGMEMAEPVVAEMPMQMTATATQAQYSLSNVAKIAMGIFAGVVVTMMATISVNTHLINQKRMNIQALEMRKVELTQEYEVLQERIEDATSEETIREYAESQGMVQSNN